MPLPPRHYPPAKRLRQLSAARQEALRQRLSRSRTLSLKQDDPLRTLHQRLDRSRAYSVIQDHDGKYRTSPAVLLACQGPDDRGQLSNLLQAHGCTVTACEDGQYALERLEAAHYDLVVTGITMPRVDGLELVRALKHRHPDLPVIAFSEGAGEMDHVYLRSATRSAPRRSAPGPWIPRHSCEASTVFWAGMR